jgi:suppressor for copper-sensitivity B
MRRPRPPLALVALLALPGFWLASTAQATEGPWLDQEQSRLRLISPWEVAPAAGPWTLGLEYELEPGWHVYWRNSGDAGFAPALSFAKTAAVTRSELLYPAPTRFDLAGGLTSFGYGGTVVYPLELELAPTNEARLELSAVVDYLICEDSCIPYQAELTLSQAVGTVPKRQEATAARLATWQRLVPRPRDAWPARARVELVAQRTSPTEAELELQLEPGSAKVGGLDLFFDVHEQLALGRPRLRLGATGPRIEVPVSLQDATQPWPATADLAWTLTGLQLDGAPLALEGRAPIALPSAPAATPQAQSRALPQVASVLLLLIALAALAVFMRRRKNRSTLRPEEDR